MNEIPEHHDRLSDDYSSTSEMPEYDSSRDSISPTDHSDNEESCLLQDSSSTGSESDF